MTWPLPIGLALGAVILTLVATGVALYVRRRRRVARGFGDPELLRRLTGIDLRRVPWRRVLLVLGGATALGIGLADPRWGESGLAGLSTGGPVVLVIDVSTSMLVDDAPPSRLAWAKMAAVRLAEALGDAPTGIVVFAGRAYALAPPTRDAGAIDLYLDALDTRMITQSGSALAGAIRQGVGLLLAGEGDGGALVVISDGNTMEEPEDLEAAVELARRARIPVFTVGVGTASGGPVPDLDPVTGERAGYLRWPDGEAVESQLSEEILRAVARGTGGTYLQANSASPERLADLVRSVAGAVEPDSAPGQPRFAWFAAAALLLLLLEGFVGRSRAPRPAARAAVLALLLFGGCDADGGVGLDARTMADSVEMYRAIAAGRPADPLPLYDLGTVLLQRQRFDEAQPPLEVATRATNPGLRRRARYNLGNTRLEPFFAASGADAPKDQEERVQVLREAVEDYRQVLLLDPSDLDAKWNLELAQRLLREERTPPPEPQEPPEPEGAGAGGGGGGGGRGGSGGADSESANQNPRPQAGTGGAERPQMSRAEAEALLDNARDRELGVQRETLAKPQPRGGVAH